MKLTALLLLLSVRIALADPHEDARNEFAAGQAADKQKDWQSAIEHYLRAYELAPHPFALFNIAADYEQLGQLREAARFYHRYLDETKDDNDRARVTKLVTDLETRPAKLTVESTPTGAKVMIDGKAAGVTPFTGVIPGGPHRIAVDTELDRQTKDIRVEYAEPVDIAFTLRGAGGTLVVTGTPAGANVDVDGSHAGVLPLAIAVPSGKHTVRTSSDGYEAKEQVAVVEPNQPTTLEVSLEKAVVPQDQATAQYMIGGIAGPAVTGLAPMYALELGVRTWKYEFLVQVGKVDDVTLVGLLYRYAFLTSRLSPYIGLGYAFIKSGDNKTGFEAEAGLKLDVLRGPVTVCLRAGVSYFLYQRDPGNGGQAETQSTVPVSFALEAAFGTK